METARQRQTGGRTPRAAVEEEFDLRRNHGGPAVTVAVELRAHGNQELDTTEKGNANCYVFRN